MSSGSPLQRRARARLIGGTRKLVALARLRTGIATVAVCAASPHTVFMTPPLGTVGLTENQARAAGYRIKVASEAVADIIAMPRAYAVEETRGLMKFVINAETDEILGAALLSIDAQELINIVALAMRHCIAATDLRDGIYTHPSSKEAFNEVLGTIVRADEPLAAQAGGSVIIVPKPSDPRDDRLKRRWAQLRRSGRASARYLLPLCHVHLAARAGAPRVRGSRARYVSARALAFAEGRVNRYGAFRCASPPDI